MTKEAPLCSWSGIPQSGSIGSSAASAPGRMSAWLAATEMEGCGVQSASQKAGSRLAVVTAGTGGLGRAIGERLARDGYALIATSRSPSPSDEVWANALTVRWGVPAAVVGWDPHDSLTDANVLNQAGGSSVPTVLVNNAGPFRRERRALANVPLAEVEALWMGNVVGGLRLTQALIPHLRRAGDGRVINLGAVGAGQAAGWTGRGPYAAVKAALASLTRTWAIEEARYHVAVNMVCPSDIKARDKERPTPGVKRPSGADVASLVAFLASPAARFITGQVLELSFGDRVGLLPGETSLPPFQRMMPIGARVQVADEKARWEGTITDVRTDGLDVECEVETVGGRRWVQLKDIRRLMPEMP